MYAFGIRRNWPTVSLLTAALLLWTLWPGGVKALLGALYGEKSRLLYDRSPMSRFVLEHLQLVLFGGVAAMAIGVVAGLVIVSPVGRPFRDLVMRIANFGQAMPSVDRKSVV